MIVLAQKNNSKNSLNSSQLTPFCPLRISKKTFSSGSYCESYSQREQLLVLLVMSGHIRVSTPSALLVVPPNNGIIIPAGVVYSLDFPTDAEVRTINLFPGSLTESSNGCCYIIGMTQLMQVLIDEVSGLDESYPIGGPQSRLVSALIDCMQTAPRKKFNLPMPSDPGARYIAETILQSPSEKANLNYWEKVVGANSRTIGKTFISEIGMNYRLYRRRIQIYASLLMLIEGRPINSVAFTVGFDSQREFISIFKRIIGVTPHNIAAN
ncbi:helix-turn-helix transcriptional regulator [Photobacterium sagamiensis]|uniref:AraC family transcriptional regulator n=1 Tax=Photobacterium sagamiensis TaxID=2910241 RepID=UPI003D136ED9